MTAANRGRQAERGRHRHTHPVLLRLVLPCQPEWLALVYETTRKAAGALGLVSKSAARLAELVRRETRRAMNVSPRRRGNQIEIRLLEDETVVRVEIQNSSYRHAGAVRREPFVVSRRLSTKPATGHTAARGRRHQHPGAGTQARGERAVAPEGAAKGMQ